MANPDPNSETSPTQLTAAERRARAVIMRRAGASFTEISRQLGISRQAAHKAVKRAYQLLAEETINETAALRALELDRLDRLHMGIWDTAIKKGPTQLEHVDRVLKISHRRAALLGLDAPRKFKVTDEDIDDAIRHELEMAGLAKGGKDPASGTFATAEPEGSDHGDDVADEPTVA